MTRMSARERRLIALLILALLLALGWLLLVMPIRAGFEERQLERESLLLTYARNERIVGQMRQSRVALLEQRKSGPRFTIVAESAPLAAGALRERIVRTARAVGVVQASASEVPAEVGLVGIRADMLMTVGQLEALLRRLQNEQPLVLVQTLAVNAEQARLTGQAEPMEVRLEVTAAYDLATAQ